MKNLPGQTPEFLNSGNSGGHTESANALLQYVQAMGPETIAHLSRPVSSEVMQVMEHNIIGLLGGLPTQNFDISVTTSREHLGRLLASAMMSGYFLRGAEQRLAFEQSIMSNETESSFEAE
ncbi:DUF760 domain-containing protein [Pseudanabaena sp. FACHB-2040]|uniref:DUF760 domain-containing protein n=1 Tax=Pseudanabaena sp. FACHB-2040 TaxID=2692859 RepID=UPI0016881DF1|nr:DUF760 domain-containing protein [Cyanobacteria bacterium Co-bin8]MBD2257715.1 DUF760 domain-containing protein [Pseudanabaena sp. FACHB-2040]